MSSVKDRKFDNIVIIEDSHGYHGTKIKISNKYLFVEPMPIAEVEELEDLLIDRGIPYVLAQVETTVYDPPRYVRGYALFVHNPQSGGSVE